MTSPKVDFALYVVAVILFALAAAGVASPRVNLLAAGLTVFALAFLVQAWGAL